MFRNTKQLQKSAKRTKTLSTTAKVRSVVTRAYLVNGGDEQERRAKLSQLAASDFLNMREEYKNGDETAIVFANKHDDFNGMTFEKAKSLAGTSKLGSSFYIDNMFESKDRFGTITLLSKKEKDSQFRKMLGMDDMFSKLPKQGDSNTGFSSLDEDFSSILSKKR